jgi:hypothetical protein
MLTRLELTARPEGHEWIVVSEQAEAILAAKREGRVIHVTVVNRHGWRDPPESLALKPEHIKRVQAVNDPRNPNERDVHIEGGRSF